jgi:hypothetical protein
MSGIRWPPIGTICWSSPQFCEARKIARWNALGNAHVRTFAAASMPAA